MPPQLEELGFPKEYLASGAGHNAVATAALADLAMLFVRCKGGISHNPAESVTISVTIEDVGAAIEEGGNR